MCVRFFGGSKWWRVQPSRVREFVFYAPKIGSHFFDRRIAWMRANAAESHHPGNGTQKDYSA